MNGIENIELNVSVVKDLKKRSDIALNMDEFMFIIADMNNPSIISVNDAIEEKLMENGIVKKSNTTKEESIFNKLGISENILTKKPTDLDKNRYMGECYHRVIEMLSALCKKIEEESSSYKVEIQKETSNSNIFEFYKDGSYIKTFKIYIGNFSGGNIMQIILSNCSYMSNSNSANSIYLCDVKDNKLVINAMMSLFGINVETPEDIVKDIWESNVRYYL